VKAMKFEWRQNGTVKDWANFRYVLEGRACDPEWVPEHVKESFSSGDYHGGSLAAADFDTGTYVYTYVVRMYVCMRDVLHMCLAAFECLYVCMYVCMHACICVYA
jgi:hypothetical protein